MLANEIKKRMLLALKARKTVEREILGVALGEIQTQAARQGKDLSDEETAGIVRKLLKSNQETLSAATNADQKQTLEQEIAILQSLLPQTLNDAEVIEALEPVLEAIRAAGNEGQATGIAMKHLKQLPAAVDGKIVAQAVKKLRA